MGYVMLSYLMCYNILCYFFPMSYVVNVLCVMCCYKLYCFCYMLCYIVILCWIECGKLNTKILVTVYFNVCHFFNKNKVILKFFCLTYWITSSCPWDEHYCFGYLEISVNWVSLQWPDPTSGWTRRNLTPTELFLIADLVWIPLVPKFFLSLSLSTF